MALGVLLAGAVGTWWLWSRPAVGVRPARPNVLLITLDTTRADRLGSYGYAPAVTPNLDRLAAGGVRFVQAVSPAPLTLPAHASLMTGRNPYAHGVRNNGHFVLAADVPTLAEQFHAAGYDTAAFVGSFVLDRQFGLARGFGHYDDALDPPPGRADSLELERRGDRTVAAATAWLAARSAAAARRSSCGCTSTTPTIPTRRRRPSRSGSPAGPTTARSRSTTRSSANCWRRRVTALAGSPLVVVAADHGESLGEHGESTHGLFVYEGAVRVPLIVSWPGAIAAGVVEPPVRLIDVAPTLVALAGLTPVPGVDGRSLVPLIDRRAAEASSAMPAYAETYFPQSCGASSPIRSSTRSAHDRGHRHRHRNGIQRRRGPYVHPHHLQGAAADVGGLVLLDDGPAQMFRAGGLFHGMP